MPEIIFAPAIQRHVTCPRLRVSAATVKDALDAAFAEIPQVRDYIVDEQGALRRHVAIFVDGRAVADRRLAETVGADAEIYVVQALSGG